ncbi:hypothetical protein TcG_07210 [Trypanosoma cruzi]|uniref:Uncharacterized protein n=1 Tax=Trypanosoma cruzi TaxID=5693 RepID=A0A2V2UNQ5_TRYCR|nr:hypothetical protein BCY84_12173 [Trypanosoma cruzi cruzi]PWU85710.1 hypothetical protein C4B63_147g266c [Trypanosoma cruzi]PWU94923.1 hypothetical protein C4B63_24g1396c [Trypanosoma cruzi]RNF15169.1 hypothetical protein TcG_07210 [Trypanosoma cruzi]
MFGRRVFGSSTIPRAMYATLHINSSLQARRMLPSLVPLTSSVAGTSRSLMPMVQCTSPSMPVLETAELDPVLLGDFLRSIFPTKDGFLRLFELWGIGRMVMLAWMRRQMA